MAGAANHTLIRKHTLDSVQSVLLGNGLTDRHAIRGNWTGQDECQRKLFIGFCRANDNDNDTDLADLSCNSTLAGTCP